MRIFCLAALLFSFTLPLFAQRVVSLMPSATMTLAQMGADSHVVGRTSFCPPAQDGKSLVVGDAMNANVEAIVSLRPDLVIASSFTPKKLTEQLSRLGIRVLSLPTAKDFNDICDQTIVLGKEVNCSSLAEQMVVSESHKVDSIASSHQFPSGGIYIQVGANPLWGATTDYYINDLAVRLHLTNILTNDGNASREIVLSRKPSYFVVASMGGLGQSEVLIWKRLSKASVCEVDSDILNCPTPQNFRRSLELICQGLLSDQHIK